MTDFDKLIKEKAEKADYPYSRSAWKNFQKHAGMSGATKFWTIGVSATLVLGTSVGLFLHQKHAGTADQGQEQISAIHNTATCISWQDSVQGDNIVVDSREDIVAKGNTGRKSREDLSADFKENASATQISSAKEDARPAVRKQYGRPLVIDVDTIKDNTPSDEELKKGNSRIF